MKKLLSLILALIMLLSVASFASAEQGEKVTVGLAGDPGNIGPFQGMGLGRIGILFTTYEMLMAKDANGKFGPVLMKEMTTVDALTYDVEIWDYIYDQAGNHLTANDIKFCYETAQATGNLPKLASIASVEVLSDYVCRFTFSSLAAGDLESLMMECPIVTQAAFEASADQMATDPVSTSPYKVVDFKAGSSITYEYTGNYWQKDELTAYTSQHNVNQIVFKIIIPFLGGSIQVKFFGRRNRIGKRIGCHIFIIFSLGCPIDFIYNNTSCTFRLYCKLKYCVFLIRIQLYTHHTFIKGR